VSGEDPEAFLRVMAAPLSTARRGEPLPGVPFSLEAVANAFVMLGLLPEARAEEILAEYRRKLEARGFRFGVLTGELSLTWATLTPGGVRLGYRATGYPDGGMSEPPRRPYRVPSRRPYGLPPGPQFAEKIQAGVSVTDNLGQHYRVRPVRGHGTVRSGQPGQPPPRWDGEMLAEPESRGARPATADGVRWLDFTPASGPAARVVMPAPAQVVMGPADPPWPTPAECYLAELASVTSMSIGAAGGTVDGTVELDTARIVAAVADALLWIGTLPPDSGLLAAGIAAGHGPTEWRQPLTHLRDSQAWRRALDGDPARAGLAARLPLRQATAVIESITAQENLVSV
jgi:hypothetical protein